jgi:hypothetical protein
MANAKLDPGGRWRPGPAIRRAAVAATGLGAAMIVALAACSSGGSGGGAAGPAGGSGGTIAPSVGGGGGATGGPTGGAIPSARAAADPSAGLGAQSPGYQPLFPFSSLAQAEAWRKAYSAGGTQPWHLDPAATATAFTAHLGLTDVKKVLTSKVNGRDARVTVGFAVPQTTGRMVTAAVVHLVRFGTSATAPWEVVGTDDSTLTLTAPRYGSVVGSPLPVGGRISGVDESIHVTVYGLASSRPLGDSCCVAAGGTGSPWHASIRFTAPPGTVLTIMVTTGGHVAEVERFAVTGVRTS